MSSALWTPSTGMSAILYVGHVEFRDITIPTPGKDLWGVDTLDRKIQGPGHLYAAKEASLAQGQVFTFNGVPYYLQTWNPIDHKIFPGFSLSYKGFRSGIPNPLPSTTRTELVSSINVDGLSVSYHGKTIVAATQEIKYIAPVTNWRYLAETEPTESRFDTVRGNSDVQVLDSRITVTFSDGTTSVMAGSAPLAVVSALAVAPVPFTIGPNFTHIIGTPFFECEEQVQIKFPE